MSEPTSLNGQDMLECGVCFMGLLAAYVVSLFNVFEKSWNSKQNQYFLILLIIMSILNLLVIFEDVNSSQGREDAYVLIETIETLINIASFYLIWLYVRSTIKNETKLSKILGIYQIVAISAMFVMTALGAFVFPEIEDFSLIVILIIAFLSGGINCYLVLKNSDDIKEAISLIVLSIIPGINSLLYNTILPLYVQYSVDVLALLICFVNVQFARGRKEEGDREFAARIQQSVLPKDFSICPSLEIFAQSRAMEQVGGDFYDFRMIDDSHAALLMADVSGHGAAASMFMMEGISTFRGLVRNQLPQNEIMQGLNNLLCEYNEAELFITAWFGILDITTGQLTYVDAGHGLALDIHKDGEIEKIKGRSSFVLAGMEGVPYRVNETTLADGDILYLFTDGVNEAVNIKMELFGDDRLNEVLQGAASGTCQELCEKVYEKLDAYCGEKEKEDDITMMAVRFTKKEESESEA